MLEVTFFHTWKWLHFWGILIICVQIKQQSHAGKILGLWFKGLEVKAWGM